MTVVEQNQRGTVIDRIHQFQKFGSVLGLERMETLLEKLGNPQEELRVIHVAGTNGKGSVCNYIYEVLLAGEYKAGLFISPYVERFNERIQLDGKQIKDADLTYYGEQVLEAAEEMIKSGADSPTEFEIVTALAFLYFSGEGADPVVLEVGLGGRGDATNIVLNPLISIITPVSMDHMEQLGNTIEAIAAEKAGIIKEGVPVVSGVQDEAAAKVVARTAYQKNAVLYDATTNPYRMIHTSTCGSIFDLNVQGTEYRGMQISMPGRHQVENARIALTTIEILRKKSIIEIDRDRLCRGFQRAALPGRFEILQQNPCLILDGAHNRQGAEVLKTALSDYVSGQNICMVIGVLKDKEVSAILDQLCEVTDRFIATEPNHIGRLKAEELCRLLQKRNKECIAIKNPVKAIEAAFKDSTKAAGSTTKQAEAVDVVVVAGSLYLISAIRGDYTHG